MIISKKELIRRIGLSLENSQTLDLSGQKIFARDLKAILKLIAELEKKSNKKIVSINLSNNFFFNEGCFLLRNQDFEKLEAENNEIEDQGAYWLSTNRKINDLNLKGNYILNKMRVRVIKALQYHRSQNSNLSVNAADPNIAITSGAIFGPLPSFPFSRYYQKLKREQLQPGDALIFFLTLVFLNMSEILVENASNCMEPSNPYANINSTSLFNNTNSFNSPSNEANASICETNTLMSTFGYVSFALGLLTTFMFFVNLRNQQKDRFCFIINKEDCLRLGTNLDTEFIEAEKLSYETLLRLPADRFDTSIPDNIPQGNCLSLLWNRFRSKPQNLQSLANSRNAPNLPGNRSSLEIIGPNEDEKKSRVQHG